jgi:RNA polymerase sigma factor (sigma-70 family)
VSSYFHRNRPAQSVIERLTREFSGAHNYTETRRLIEELGAASGRVLTPDAPFDLGPALERLTRQQLEVLTLRYLVGLSTGEIAELMGKQPPAVHSLEARALARIRRALE